MKVVNIYDTWTQALDMAEGTPAERRKVLLETPYAMPMVPSISWAKKPKIIKIKILGIKSS